MAEQEFIPEWGYEAKFEDASALLGSRPEDLISIKIRPVEDVGTFVDREVYTEEYDEINIELAQFRKLGEEPAYRTRAILYELADGNQFIFERHETGPEIIFVVGIVKEVAITAGAVAIAGNQIIKLVNSICKIINKSADAKNNGRKSDRYFGASAINVEKRMVKGAKIIRQVKVTAGHVRDAISDVDDLLR